jgi:hypothetical protein
MPDSFLVMLRHDWPADVFHRKGLTFQRGVPRDVDATQLENLAKRDLGNALVLVNPETAKADHAATADAAADVDCFLLNPPPRLVRSADDDELPGDKTTDAANLAASSPAASLQTSTATTTSDNDAASKGRKRAAKAA